MGENQCNGKRVGVIDEYIGEKIKIKRMQFGVSQAKLGRLLGVTFQQIQKCEKGLNRTPVSRLYKISQIFHIEINYFFEGIEDFLKLINEAIDGVKVDVNTNKQDKKKSRELENEILKLNRFFILIENKETRKLVLEVVKTFGKMPLRVFKT